MPVLQSAARREGRFVAFVGIDVNDTRTDALAFLTRVGVTYPVAYDGTGQTTGRYGLFGLPSTVFVNPAGTIVGVHAGALTSTVVAAALHQAFGTS